MKKYLTLVAISMLSFGFAQKQQIQVKRATVGFLNVENLWDTISSADYIDGTLSKSNPAFHRSIPVDSIKFLKTTEDYQGQWSDDLLIGKKVVRNQTLSDDFTPKSAKNYNTKVYKTKLANESKVISELGGKYTNNLLPVVVGLIEVENRKVVEDLVKQPALNKFEWGVVHYNSYDARGIDVAVIYQKKRFVVTDSYKKEVIVFNEDGNRQYTRDVLVVKGLLDGDKIAVFMNHWPSRSGGEAASAPRRNAAAAVLKGEMDKIRAAEPDRVLIAMGDFNDDPVNKSLVKHLGAVGDKKELTEQSPYYNLMYKMFKNGVATLGYRDAPNLFDQIIVSKNALSDKVTKNYSVFKAEVYAPTYLISTEGQYKGYPFRSWAGDTFTGGYSDHFPSFVVLQKEYTPVSNGK